ncbi:hypothetical protein TNIN_158521, partial [Trichonephila inaurata madagascariensis]
VQLVFHMLGETLCDIAANSFALGLVVHLCIRSIYIFWSNNLNHPHNMESIITVKSMNIYIGIVSPTCRTSMPDSDDKIRGCGW